MGSTTLHVDLSSGMPNKPSESALEIYSSIKRRSTANYRWREHFKTSLHEHIGIRITLRDLTYRTGSYAIEAPFFQLFNKYRLRNSAQLQEQLRNRNAKVQPVNEYMHRALHTLS